MQEKKKGDKIRDNKKKHYNNGHDLLTIYLQQRKIENK